MKTPLVSVIIPTYNEEKNIRRLLDSVFSQSYPKLEAIVVDDGSKDRTVEIAEKAGAKVFARKHAERSVQRNFGAKKARGEYLVFLDADMELTENVVKSAVKLAQEEGYKAITIPEQTTGEGLLSRVRRFEREMYMNEPTFEVARFFDRKTFQKFDGYDPKLTGPEDYDLPYRISKEYKIGRVDQYILHHEVNPTLGRLVKKKYYYAKHGAYYAEKHPELVLKQGNLLFRSAYIKNWRHFLKEPIIGSLFLFVRALEAFAAIAGFVSATGLTGFVKTFFRGFAK